MTDELSNVTSHLNLPAINILQENNNNNSNSERSDFIILSRAKRARSLLTETETDFDLYIGGETGKLRNQSGFSTV